MWGKTIRRASSWSSRKLARSTTHSRATEQHAHAASYCDLQDVIIHCGEAKYRRSSGHGDKAQSCGREINPGEAARDHSV